MTRRSSQARFRPTLFSCHARDAEAVFLAGTVNDWNPEATRLKKGSAGSWSVALELAPGRYEYKFLVDGRWCCYPDSDDQSQGGAGCVPNPHGTMNRVVVVE